MNLLGGQRDAEIVEASENGRVALLALYPQAREKVGERVVLGRGEVAKQVDRSGVRRAGDLTAGYETDPQLGRAFLRRLDPEQPVVVGERHRATTRLDGELHDALGAVRSRPSRSSGCGDRSRREP